MAVNNAEPTTSRAENYAKYAEYFEDKNSNTTLSIETFFTLLMAEMSNQDPLEPQSNTEFISQLANFTALQNSSNTLYYNTVAYASSLAGKTVTVATAKSDGKGLDITTGVVTDVDISDGNNIEIIVNGKRYMLSNVMNVATGASSSYTSGSDGAYAVSLIGKKVTLLAETDDGTVIDEGIVENIEVENGVYRVVVNGFSYTLDTIVKVANPDGSMAAQPGSTDKDDKVTDDTDSDDKVTDTDKDDKVTDEEEDTEAEEGGITETSIMEENEALKELFS